MKSLLLAFSLLLLATTGGCALYSDNHTATQSGTVGEKERLFWTDRSWRKAKSQEWIEEDRRLSRLRLQQVF